MIRYLMMGALLLWSAPFYSQVGVVLLKDTLEEVLILDAEKGRGKADHGSATTALEEALDRQAGIDLMTRGMYAQEIVYRGLNSNQAVLLIDGMRMYGACTDKMDPVTSYVDRSNLHSLGKSGGNENSLHNLDLTLKKASFSDEVKRRALLSGAYMHNNHAGTWRGEFKQEGKHFWILGTASMVDAVNYKDGRGEEVLYSQYHKRNLFIKSGIKLNASQSVELSAIIDRAHDIGYPSLPMDVAYANAVILKAAHVMDLGRFKMHNAMYYNEVAHRMDDSGRDSVAVRMDMPGWSSTMGITGNVRITRERSIIALQYELVSNTRKAEMTMYVPDARPMYMETWPEVRRDFVSLSPSFAYYLNAALKLKASANLSIGQDVLTEEFGIYQLEVLGYHDGKRFNAHAGNVAVEGEYSAKHFSNVLNLKIGTRAPELSERIGYYLFNSQDLYDYIGNPWLKNERFIMVENKLSLPLRRQKLEWTNYAYFFDRYIFGIVEPTYQRMTIGAEGVKVYENIGAATVLGSEASLALFGSRPWPAQLSAAIRYGTSERIEHLPLMAPLEMRYQQSYSRAWFRATAEVQLLSAYMRASSYAGERNVPAYALAHVGVAAVKDIKSTTWNLELGIRNVFDHYYTTHLSWRGIPMPGRNAGLTLTATF